VVGCRRQAERNEEEDGGDNEENDHSPKKQKPPENPSNPTDYKPRKPEDDDEENPNAEATRKTGGVGSKEGNTSGQQLATSSKNSNPGNTCSGKETDSSGRNNQQSIGCIRTQGRLDKKYTFGRIDKVRRKRND